VRPAAVAALARVAAAHNVAREELVVWFAQPGLGQRAPETWYEQDVVLRAEGRWVEDLVEDGPQIGRWSWDLLHLALPSPPATGGVWMLDRWGAAWVRPTVAQLVELAEGRRP
jgi:hypothetical protein